MDEDAVLASPSAFRLPPELIEEIIDCATTEMNGDRDYREFCLSAALVAPALVARIWTDPALCILYRRLVISVSLDGPLLCKLAQSPHLAHYRLKSLTLNKGYSDDRETDDCQHHLTSPPILTWFRHLTTLKLDNYLATTPVWNVACWKEWAPNLRTLSVSHIDFARENLRPPSTLHLLDERSSRVLLRREITDACPHLKYWATGSFDARLDASLGGDGFNRLTELLIVYPELFADSEDFDPPSLPHLKLFILGLWTPCIRDYDHIESDFRHWKTPALRTIVIQGLGGSDHCLFFIGLLSQPALAKVNKWILLLEKGVEEENWLSGFVEWPSFASLCEARQISIEFRKSSGYLYFWNQEALAGELQA